MPRQTRYKGMVVHIYTADKFFYKKKNEVSIYHIYTNSVRSNTNYYLGFVQQEGKIRVGHTWWVLVACEELTKGGGLAALGQPSQQKRESGRQRSNALWTLLVWMDGRIRTRSSSRSTSLG